MPSRPREAADTNFGRQRVHPHLWTVPGIGFPIRTWGFMVAVGIAVAVVISWRRAKRRGLDPGAITSIAIIGVVAGVVGCRAMHYLHHFGRQLFSGEMKVTEVITATGGGEILGGVVLAVLCVIAYLRIYRLPIGEYLDIGIPPMLLAMGIGRIGCIAFGCCWGGVCETGAHARALPWAIQFPYGSPAYLRHVGQGDITVPDALIWKDPETHERAPIPRAVLQGVDVDRDPGLLDWAGKMRTLAVLKQQGAPADEVAEAEQAAKHAAEGLSRPSAVDVAAAAHLAQLADAHPDGAPTWADLRTLAARQHSRWVHPAQLYDAISLTLLFFVLSAIHRRRRRAGMVVAWAMMLYPINRVLQEMIRGDNPHDVFGLTISQFSSLLILLAGVALALVLRRRPPNALPVVAPATGSKSA